MSTKHTLEQILNVSKDIFKTCALTDALIERAGNKLIVNTQWSQTDIEKNERSKFQKTQFLEVDAKQAKVSQLYVSRPQQVQNSVWNVKAPNNLKTAIVRNWKDKNEDKQFLELWNNDIKIESLNLTKLDKHSKVYENSSSLGSFVWSSDSKKIAYVAEMKKTGKEKTFFSGDKAKEDSIDETNFEQKYGNYYADDWGEQYVGKSQAVIALFCAESLDVKILENLPEDYTPGQVSWYKNEGLLFSAYYTRPYKLGLIYCPVRKSELFYYDLEKNTCTPITDCKTQSVRDPKFSHDFENICWLQNQARGPHFQCSKLMMMNWKTREITTLVDIVNNPKASQFPGIYAVGFPKNCWSIDNKRVLINTQWNRANRMISVDIDTKKITNLKGSIDELNTLNCLTIEDDWICAALAGYNRRPSMVIGKLPERGSETEINWCLTDSKDELMDSTDVELINLMPKIPDTVYPQLNFEAILIKPKENNKTLVVLPHGGPHSCFCADFSSHVAIMYKLGYSVLCVNYRGSTGNGQDSIDSLPGKVGTNDVNDCQQAAEFCKEKYDYKNVVLYGGSHGGFLTTHLIGQFPDFYTAASVRNAVTHLEAELFVSDIPDWVMCEGTGTYDFNHKSVGSPEIFSELYARSPIKYIDNVKTPLLLMIGCADLRVPPSQGMEYYKALVARNVPTKALIFKEDNHPLDIPQTLADCIVSTVLWYEKYIN